MGGCRSPRLPSLLDSDVAASLCCLFQATGLAQFRSQRWQRRRGTMMDDIVTQTDLLRRSFTDFDEFTEVVRDWDLEWRQLDPGRFDADVLQYRAHQTVLGWARASRRLEQRAASPGRVVTIVVPGREQTACGRTSPFHRGMSWSPAPVVTSKAGLRRDGRSSPCHSQQRVSIQTWQNMD